MAEMIPDRMPSGASVGEKTVFAILQNLPDDYLVYYEPIVSNRYPDFVVICPDLGLIVVEVKGWYPAEIREADGNEVVVSRRQQTTRERHPLRQAREYMFGLMDSCRQHAEFRCLLNGSGPHQDRFNFPFGHFAVLSNITSQQLAEHEMGDLGTVFPPNRVVTRDVLQNWRERQPEQVHEEIRTYFDPFWPITPLTERQVNVLRAVIHPEIRLAVSARSQGDGGPASATSELTLATLDLRQERHARSIGSGHRVIYGVAGSGKTVLLIARVRLIARENPSGNYLFLCYNVSLRAHLEHALADVPNIKVRHFDGWAIDNGVRRDRGEDDDSLGNRLLTRLRDGYGSAREFDAVFVDEAQDFHAIWFQCVLEALKEPNDGDLIIVSDGSQGLYRKLGVSWRSLGINAAGRTLYRQLDLDRNYRNTREILKLASLFAAPPAADENDEFMAVLAVDPTCALRGGPSPHLIRCAGYAAECDWVVRRVSELLAGSWGGQPIEPCRPEEIGVLYPRLEGRRKATFFYFKSQLEELASVVWLNETSQSRRLVNAPGLKIQTIHSAKGLQYRAVILLWADLLPAPFDDCNPEDDRRVMYVALTRAEELLAITYSAESPFVSEIRASGACAEPVAS